MTEAEWLASGDPAQLTEAAVERGWVSDRKLRLWACACCRRIWPLLVNECSQKAVEVGERFADGEATEAERAAACEATLAGLTFEATREQPESAGWQEAACAASDAADNHLAADQHEFVYRTTTALSSVAAARDPWLSTHWDTTREYRDRLEQLTEAVEAAEKWEQARLVRDIIGNPFRPLAQRPFPAHIVCLARSCYATFPEVNDDYLILADALEEIGETDAASHCREKVHVKGCHVLDWLLDKS
jgi:hypothetical protein